MYIYIEIHVYDGICIYFACAVFLSHPQIIQVCQRIDSDSTWGSPWTSESPDMMGILMARNAGPKAGIPFGLTHYFPNQIVETGRNLLAALSRSLIFLYCMGMVHKKMP